MGICQRFNRAKSAWQCCTTQQSVAGACLYGGGFRKDADLPDCFPAVGC